VYDPTGVWKEARKLINVNLGFWHTYKQCQLLVHKKFAPFFAQRFHALHPATNFFEKPKLVTVTASLMTLRLAYSIGSTRARLQGLMANPKLTKPNRAYVANINALCAFFIPVVPARKNNDYFFRSKITVWR
jgi:hypothetical protein